MQREKHPLAYLCRDSCPDCSGTGWRDDDSECKEIDRGCFNAVMLHYKYCREGSGFASSTPLARLSEGNGTRTPGSFRGFAREDFMCSVYLCAKRVLSPRDFLLWKLYWLEETPWQVVSQRLKISRRVVFYTAQKVSEALGQVFRTLRPYRLWPISVAMSAPVRGSRVAPCIPEPRPERIQPPLARPRAPLAKAA